LRDDEQLTANRMTTVVPDRGRAGLRKRVAQPRGPGARGPRVAGIPGLADEEVDWASSRVVPVSIDALAAHWRSAFDAAEAALRAAGTTLSAQELREHRKLLAGERDSTARLLEALAQEERESGRFLHLRIRMWDARRLLGLPSRVVACVFNLDGVLIGSAVVHAAAWTETFDEFISARLERTRGRFAPFNPRTDYQRYLHGRPRLDGVRAFLASRGISLPEGNPGDAPGTETVHGLANRKNEGLRRRLDEQGVTAFSGSRRYLETARDAGVRRAVVSASANTAAILERAGLTDLIDNSVDGNTILAEQLRSKPAPDILLAACRQLGVEPQQTAAFETSPAGVAAARAANFALVVGVDATGQAEALRSQGADLVVAGLAEILERNLAVLS
jgi:beta-phosphoglucomutase family hydrolase